MNIKDKAKEFAINAHKGQIRKSDKEKPMIIHPINVADILSEYGFDDNVVAAGYLHDVIEDTKYTKEDLLKAFNEDILSLVLGDTEKDKSLSWEERKIETINIQLFPERRFYHDRFQFTTTHIDTNFRTCLAVFRFHIPHADTDFAGRRHSARSNDPNLLPIRIYKFIPMTGNSTINHFKAN